MAEKKNWQMVQVLLLYLINSMKLSQFLAASTSTWKQQRYRKTAVYADSEGSSSNPARINSLFLLMLAV